MKSRLAVAVLLGLAILPAASAPAFAGAASMRVDGSSTVYPITEAVAEEFQKARRDVRVTVGISGTGGGFKKFCAGEVDLVDASRPIKQAEVDACGKNGIQYVELPIVGQPDSLYSACGCQHGVPGLPEVVAEYDLKVFLILHDEDARHRRAFGASRRPAP